MKKHLMLATVSIVAVGLSGCVQTRQPGMYSVGGTSGYMPPQQGLASPSAQQGAQQDPEMITTYQPALSSQNTEVLEKLATDMNSLYQRMQRAERAMIRLDRRMQLIERNELGRMGANDFEAPAGNTQKMSAIQPAAGAMPAQSQTMAAFSPSTQNVPPKANPYPTGMMPVVASLQPAAQHVEGRQVASLQQQRASHLPSLADSTEKSVADPSMAVWTVHYIDGKVWPDRNQLPASRQVVSALRSGKPVALFARGAQPNSKEFRERVRALSRYLSKVADSERVAISAMPADHLDSDTIEIFATR